MVILRDAKRVAQAEIIYILLTIDDQRLEASRQDFLDVLTRQTQFVEADDGDSEDAS